MRRALVVALLLTTSLSAAAQDDRELRRSAVVRAVERAGPAVVNVYTEEMVAQRDWSGDFFRDVFEPRFKRKLETTSLGSGTIIDAQGHVLTNFHVVQRGAKIKVALVDRREFEARLVGTDPDLDLAVLKLQTDEKLPFMPMGDSADLMVGETVIAIGNPFGLSNTVTTGVISAVHRNLNADGRTYYDFVQTDASINPGNSGGPLLDITGRLIGVNTAIYGPGASIGIGFAIPVNRARRIVQDLITHGSIQLAYVGLDLGQIEGDEVRRLGLPQKTAVKVVAVEEDGPAARGGLRVGDVVVAVESFPIETPADYTAKMRDFTAGNVIKLQVLRGGAPLDLAITAGKVPLELADRIVEGQLGLTVKAPTTRHGRGVIIDQIKGGLPAARARLKPGDVILQVNAADVASLDDFRGAILRARRKGQVEFLVKRGRYVDRVEFKL